MTVAKQIEFAEELEMLFLKKDKQFSIFGDYDGAYRTWADNMGEILESLHRLNGLER